MKRMKGKVLAVLMSLAMVFTVIPLMGGAAYAEDSLPECDGFEVYLYMNEGTAKICGRAKGNDAADITIPAEVTYGGKTYTVNRIDTYAFENDQIITSLEVSDGISEIGSMAFKGCTNLTSIKLPDSVLYINNNSFRDTGYYKNKNNWEDGMLYIGNCLIEVDGRVTECEIRAESVTVANEACWNNRYLSSLTVPQSLKRIGEEAFHGCINLKTVSFEADSGLTEIGLCAFMACSSLEEIDIPASVKLLGNSAFDDSGLKKVNFAEGSELETIEPAVFTNTAITDITLPASVTNIGSWAFDCSGLKTVYYRGTKSQWDDMTGRDSNWTGGRDVEVVCLDIGDCVATFDQAYLVEDDDPSTPYVEQYYVVPEGTVLSPVVARGDTVLSTDCYKARYSEVYYNEDKGEYNLIDENDWTEAFPTTHGDYLCIVEGIDPYYGSFEWIPIIKIPIDENDEYELANYQATFDEEYLVEDDDPSTPYVEQYYDVPEGIVPKLTVSKEGNDLGLGCYKALYSEVYYNEEKGEYNLIDEDAWSIEFPTKQGVYLCKVDGVSPYHCSVGNMIPLIRITTDISKDKVELSKASFVYNGKVQKPSVKTIGGKTLKEGTDYTVSWSNASSKNAGTYTVTVKGKGIYKGTTKATYTIAKAANPLTIKAKTATVKGSTKGKNGKLKKTKTLAVSKVIAFTKNGQGKMTYTKSSGSKKITINKTTGKVTVKKGLKKGTYKVKVKVKAAGNANYKASAVKTVTFKVKVK